MNDKKFFPLSKITDRIQAILQPAIGKQFWVKAEISSGRERGGSFYCDLVETNENAAVIAKIRGTVWNRDLARIRKQFKDSNLDLKLDDGTVVGFQCSLQYSPQYGLSLQVIDADPAFALGELELKKQQILARLTKEGLLEPNKKFYVPVLPQRIGVITSMGSAAYSDFLKTLNSSKFGFKVYMADAMMQGNQTERSVLHALDTLEKLKLDLVILIRGGGSKTDLFYLDNEAIARRIAGYTLPVWTGIGHEIDTSVLDHVANKYFKTPTAVAEEIIARYVDMRRHLNEAKNRFQSTWTYRLDREKKTVSDAHTGIIQGTRKLLEHNSGNLKNMANLLSSKVKDRLMLEKSMLSASMKLLTTAPVNLIQRVQDRLKDKTHRFKNGCDRQVLEGKQTLEYLMKRFQPEKFNQRIVQEWRNLNSWKGLFTRKVTADFNTRYKEIDYLKNRLRKEVILTRIENERKSLNNKSATLKASDPETSLKRGFSLVYNEVGGLIKSVSEIKNNDVLRTKLSDGQVTSTVNDIERK